MRRIQQYELIPPSNDDHYDIYYYYYCYCYYRLIMTTLVTKVHLQIAENQEDEAI